MTNTVASPPITEAIETTVFLACSTIMQNTAAALEPAVIPMTFGFAKGFRSIVWNI